MNLNIKYESKVIGDKTLTLIDCYSEISRFFLTKNIKSISNNIEIYFPSQKPVYPYIFLNPRLQIHERTKNKFGIFCRTVKFLFYKEPKFFRIFFTGENLYGIAHFNHVLEMKYDMFDMWIDFPNIKHKNYARMPLYFTSTFPMANDINIKIIKDFFINIEKNKLTSLSRNKMITLIASHDSYSGGIRGTIADSIADIFNYVEYPGKFRKNTDDLQKLFGNDKEKYLKEFNFNICPENTNNEGYVTEKLWHAVINGCIPIYWGSLNNPDPLVFNHDRILFFDLDNPQNLRNKILKLVNDEKYCTEFLAQPVFMPTAAEYIYNTLDNIYQRMTQMGIEFNNGFSKLLAGGVYHG